MLTHQSFVHACPRHYSLSTDGNHSHCTLTLQAASAQTSLLSTELDQAQGELDSAQSSAEQLELLQAQLREATQKAESLSADLAASQEEAGRMQQEAAEQAEELQQQLQERLLAAGSLTERALSAEESGSKVSMLSITLIITCHNVNPTLRQTQPLTQWQSCTPTAMLLQSSLRHNASNTNKVKIQGTSVCGVSSAQNAVYCTVVQPIDVRTVKFCWGRMRNNVLCCRLPMP